MNNTKWREVFICLAENNIRFSLSFIENPAKKTALHNIYQSLVEERGVGDGGVGPFEYKEIYLLQIPKTIRTPKMMRGEIYGYNETKQETQELLKSLDLLGQLPISETDEFIEINGYI